MAKNTNAIMTPQIASLCIVLAAGDLDTRHLFYLLVHLLLAAASG